MKKLIEKLATVALIVVSLCSVANADQWIPESPLRPRPPQNCYEPIGRLIWIPTRVIRTYWVRLPCGRLELWEDIIPGHFVRVR